MLDLKNIQIKKVQHPGLGPDQPFNLVAENMQGAMTEFAGDMHYALQFCIVLQGGMELVFEDFQRHYAAGEVWWTMLWEPHAFRFTGKKNLALAVNIDFDYLGNCDPFESCDWSLPFAMKASQRYCPGTTREKEHFSRVGKQLYKLWQSQLGLAWKIRSWLMIHELIAIAVSDIAKRQHGAVNSGLSESFRKIKPAIDLVRSKVGRSPSIDEAAEKCFLSSSRFAHLFKDVMGLGFGKFALRARLAGTTKDLKQRNMTIEDIAEKWGFVDHSHFLHSFKKVYGCTPRQYQISD